jgi:hypothetical protein
MPRSLRFGSTACDSNALFRLAFATAPPHGLTSPHTITRRLILQKARSHITNKSKPSFTLLRLVGTRFQVLFHDPSPGRFSPFPHGTCSLSVIREYLGLPGGPGRFTRDFTGPVLLGKHPMKTTEFRLPDYHRLRSTIPDRSTTLKFSDFTSGQADQIQMLPQPHTRNARRLSHAHGLASSPFAHHYSGNHCCFLFLRVLRCFTSPRYHQPPYQFRRRQHPMTGAGLPHSETPGSTLGCQLPGAYRRLPRPSSAPDAKASTVCP